MSSSDDSPCVVICDDKEFSYSIHVPRKYGWAIEDGPNSSLCDVSLVFDDGSVSVHGDVFMHLSAFFRTMLSANWIETKTHRVHFPEIKYCHMRSLVDMIYAKKFFITKHNIEPIFHIVHQLQMDQLLGYYSDVLTDSLNHTNVLALYELANRYSLLNLHEECMLYVLENCKELFDRRDFLEEIPFEFVKKIVERDDIFVKNELDVLLIVLSWLNVDARRDAYKIALFERVRFPHLNRNCKQVLKNLTPFLVDSAVYTMFCKGKRWLNDMPIYQLRARKFQPVHLHFILKVNYVNFGKPNRAYAIMLYCNILNKVVPLHEYDHGISNSYNATFGPHEYGEGFSVVGRYAYLQERMILRGHRRERLRLTRTNLQPNKFGRIQTQNIHFPVADQSLYQIGKFLPHGRFLQRLHVVGQANSLGAEDLREIRTSFNFDRIIYGLENISVLKFDVVKKRLTMGPALMHTEDVNREALSTRAWLFVLLTDRMCKWIYSEEYSFVLSSALDGLNEVIKINNKDGRLSRVSFKPETPGRRTLPRGVHDILLISDTLYIYECLDVLRDDTNKVHRRFRAMNAHSGQFTGIMVVDAENDDPTAKLLFSICEMDFNKLELIDIRGKPHIVVVPRSYQLGTLCYFGVFQIIRELADNGDSLKLKKVRLDKLDINEFRKLPEDSCVKIETSQIPVDFHPCAHATFMHDQLHRLSDYYLEELEGLRRFAI